MFYVWKSVMPTGLSALHELPARLDAGEARFIAGFVFVAIAAGAMWMLSRRAPGLAAAGLVYLIVVSPVLGIMQSGIQLVADRYSYLACISLAIGVGGAGLALSERSAWRRAIALGGVGAAIALG